MLALAIWYGLNHYTSKSVANRVDASACVSGNEYGTSEQPLVWHRWPYPTVGKPIGSGDGDATKPSNDLIREIVAAFTAGPLQSGAAAVTDTRERRRADEALDEYCIVCL
jgi:hypothetical protein